MAENTAEEAAPASATSSPSHNTNTMPHVSYVPHDLKYSPSFESSLLDLILNSKVHDSAEQQLGIRIIKDESSEAAEEGVSIRASDIDPANLAVITEQELPLSLEDSRRIYASPVPGILLTHPGGYLEGGPGLDPEEDTFSEDFLSTHASEITSEQTLQACIDSSIQERTVDLKKRMENRRRAKERNDQLERELKSLTDQHIMELRIHNRMAEDRKKKKEAKANKRAAG